MRLSKEGQRFDNPQDILKNPLVLEFYGLERSPSYSESDLESAIIANLKKFLLELGKGFLFEARQKLMYVNYFDRYVKREYEKPTVGILLCQEKDDIIMELTLPQDTNIYASEYSLYLPDKTLLQQKLAEWVKEFEEKKEVIQK